MKADESGFARTSEDRLHRLRQRLRGHVDILAELIGERNSAHPEGLDAAREYIRRQLREMGHAFVQHEFQTSWRKGMNLEVILPGARQDASSLVVGAHYDSAAGTPGADDNASAVAMLLEVARSLSKGACRRGVRLVFLDCEEPPHFNFREMGSQHHARSLRMNGERIMGMICLESLGYFSNRPRDDVRLPWYARVLNRVAGGAVVVVSDLPSMRFGLRVVWALLRSGGFPFVPAALPRQLLPIIEFSDHRSYWDEGYSALMMTDTAFLRNPHYHRPTDRLETLDLEKMAAFCQALEACIARLAGRQ